VRINWPAELTRYGIPQKPLNAQKALGQILKSSRHLSLGVDAFVDPMGVLVLVPFVIVQIATNPAASWLMWPSFGAEWRCRPVDFVAIALHLTRLYGGLSVEAPPDLRVAAEAEYQHVAAPSLHRLTH